MLRRIKPRCQKKWAGSHCGVSPIMMMLSVTAVQLFKGIGERPAEGVLFPFSLFFNVLYSFLIQAAQTLAVGSQTRSSRLTLQGQGRQRKDQQQIPPTRFDDQKPNNLLKTTDHI